MIEILVRQGWEKIETETGFAENLRLRGAKNCLENETARRLQLRSNFARPLFLLRPFASPSKVSCAERMCNAIEWNHLN